jgi:hypothetical protein
MSEKFDIFAAVNKLKDDDVIKLIEAAKEIKKGLEDYKRRNVLRGAINVRQTECPQNASADNK